MKNINPQPKFINAANYINPADLRDGLGWFVFAISAFCRGENLSDELLDDVRSTTYALHHAGVLVLDELHTRMDYTQDDIHAFSLNHPYGFKLTLVQQHLKADYIIINDDTDNRLVF